MYEWMLSCNYKIDEKMKEKKNSYRPPPLPSATVATATIAAAVATAATVAAC